MSLFTRRKKFQIFSPIMIFSFFSLSLLSSSCIKTAEQLSREKKIDSMSNQLGDTQGLLSGIVSQLRSVQDQVNQLNGRLEEMEYRQTQNKAERLLPVERIEKEQSLILEQQKIDQEMMKEIQQDLKAQKEFLQKVNQSLEKLSKNIHLTTRKKSPSDKSLLRSGLKLIKQNKFKKAQEILKPLVGSQKITAGQRNKVLHGLGKIAFYTQQYDEALTYFSKIFTKYPRSSLAPSSLLFIGRSLKKLGKKEEALEAFNQVISNYKNTSEANEAKKEI